MPPNEPVARKSFREQQFEAREQAILDATNRLLAQRGFELISMDDIASEVGIAKGSLYRHFASKEALAAVVMVRLLQRTRAALAEQSIELPAIERIAHLLRWTFRERLAGAIPNLPSASPALREALGADPRYMDELLGLSEEIGGLIRGAQASGQMRTDLDDSVLLFSLFARSCDPTIEFLKAAGALGEEEMIEQLVSACLEGLRGGGHAGAARSRLAA
jgi:AcrR family transcriptional regulator